MKKLFLVMTVLMSSSFAFSQQLAIPRPSPTQKVEQAFATSKIIIEYSRPSVKGRTIFGELVPFDSLWRTGANASTKIYFGEDITLEDNRIPTGMYSLFTIPGRQSWTIILSKDTSLSGTAGYKKENDLVRFNVKSQSLPMSIETFTIDIANIKPNACDIALLWDKTMVRMHVVADIDAKIMRQIDEAMKTEKPPYGQAATYYYENGKDLAKAYEWINKAIEGRPDAYWFMLTKARIEMKLGKTTEAISTAQKAKELSLKDDNRNDAKQADAIIADAKAKKG